MRIASILLLIALLLTKQSHGYPLGLQRHPLSPSIHKNSVFGGRIRRVNHPVSLGAIHVNKNEGNKEDANVTEELNSRSTTSQAAVEDATEPLQQPRDVGNDESNVSWNNDEAVTTQQRLRNTGATKNKKRDDTGSVKNPIALFFENLIKSKGSARAETKSSQQTGERLQSYFAYTFGSEEDRKASATRQSNDSKIVSKSRLRDTGDDDLSRQDERLRMKERLRKGKAARSIKKGNVRNPFALFFENLIKPLSFTRAANETSQARNLTRRTGEPLQSYLAYTFGSDEDRKTSSMQQSNATVTMSGNETNPLATIMQRFRSRPHTGNETNTVVSFFQRLLNRNATTTSPDSPTLPRKRPPRQRQDLNAIARFFQHIIHRNTTGSFDSKQNATLSSPPIPTQNSTIPLAACSWDSTDNKYKKPVGDRWAIPSKTTDFSGKWKPILSPQFKRDYDTYLQNCGQSFAFRTLCLNFVGTTREVIHQDGNFLNIKGTNPVGVWERTLVASGSDLQSADYKPFNVTFLDPDKDTVNVEAWWEEEGTVHKSWLRGKKRVHGGEFESTRYLEESDDDESEGDVLVCESQFHPNGAKGFLPAFIKWRFKREE